MGRDLTLYPRKATKDALKKYLEGLGFNKCGHLWEWSKGTANYHWFNCEDYKSTDGVSADVYPVSEEELCITGNKWALHVRNLYGASWHDVKMLNDVLRGARKIFGGTIKGDYGTNRYASLWEDKSTPISRGISGIHRHVKREISMIRLALPDPYVTWSESGEGEGSDAMEYFKSLDPSRVIYNGLVPFALSMFEYFFSRSFQVLIKYDPVALEKRVTHKQKLDFQVLLEVEKKGVTIEDVIARNYTFHNISQLNKAYKDWLNIDVRKILYKKKKIGNSLTFLENRIADIVQYRHGIIHHLAIDRSLAKDGYIHILDAVEKSIDEFAAYAEKKYDFKVKDH